jgi:hypothetical protein
MEFCEQWEELFLSGPPYFSSQVGDLNSRMGRKWPFGKLGNSLPVLGKCNLEGSN